MSFDTLGDLNWLAVIVAAIVYMALGAIWYQPFAFGRIWSEASGVPMPEPGESAPPTIYLSPLIAYFLSTVATAMLARATGSDTLGHAIVLGIVVGVGYVAALTMVGATFEPKPKGAVWFAITAGFNVLALVIVSVIVTVWD